MFLAFFELVDTEFTDGNIFTVILSDSNDCLLFIVYCLVYRGTKSNLASNILLLEYLLKKSQLHFATGIFKLIERFKRLRNPTS
jgi:hypothetical protein